jgi:hypothetical protein
VPPTFSFRPCSQKFRCVGETSRILCSGTRRRHISQSEARPPLHSALGSSSPPLCSPDSACPLRQPFFLLFLLLQQLLFQVPAALRAYSLWSGWSIRVFTPHTPTKLCGNPPSLEQRPVPKSRTSPNYSAARQPQFNREFLRLHDWLSSADRWA